MIYALLLKHIGLVNPPEPIRAELRPPALDCRNPDLNGEAAPDHSAGLQQRRSFVAPVSTGCGKTLSGLQEVSGHDFSRAETAAKSMWPLGPAECLLA
jgi:hypothetical protein